MIRLLSLLSAAVMTSQTAFADTEQCNTLKTGKGLKKEENKKYSDSGF